MQLEHYDDDSGANTTDDFFRTTGSSVYLVPLVQKARIPFISLAGAGAIIDEVKHWVFKTPHTDHMAATDHRGLDLSAFRLLEVRNGAWSLVQ